jgi:hypothetical protein
LSQIAQNHPTGLTANLLKLFEPGPPLEYKSPAEKRQFPAYSAYSGDCWVPLRAMFFEGLEVPCVIDGRKVSNLLLLIGSRDCSVRDTVC